jgi:hypothetical protein
MKLLKFFLKMIATLAVLVCVFFLSEIIFPEWHRHILALIGISLPFDLLMFAAFVLDGGFDGRNHTGC